MFEIVNCFPYVFFKKSQIYKHITHSPDNSIISAGLHFVQFGFLLRPGHGPISEGGGGGRKPKLREEQRNEGHKSSENVQEK